MRISAHSLSGITRTGSKGIISARYDKAPQKRICIGKENATLYTAALFPAAKIVYEMLKTKQKKSIIERMSINARISWENLLIYCSDDYHNCYIINLADWLQPPVYCITKSM